MTTSSPRFLSLLPLLNTAYTQLPKAHIYLLIVSIIGLGLLGVGQGQDTNWDFRNYHWYNAYAVLNHRLGYDLLAAQLPSFHNPALDIPYYLLVTHSSAWIAQFTLSLIQGLNLLLLYALARHLFGAMPTIHARPLAYCLALMGMLGGGGIALLGTTFHDNITSLGLFLSMHLLLRRQDWEKLTPYKRIAHALCAGLPLGLMVGCKLTVMPFAIGVALATLFLTPHFKQNLSLTMALGIGLFLGWMIAYAPWALYLQTTYESPLFPYFNKIFQSSYMPIDNLRDTKFVPQSWLPRLFYPLFFTPNPLLVGEVPWHDARLAVAYVLALGAAALKISQVFFSMKPSSDHQPTLTYPPSRRFILIVAASSYGVWLVLFSIYRYAIPLEMLAPMIIMALLDLIIRHPLLKITIAALLMLWIGANIHVADWGRRPQWVEPTSIAVIPKHPLFNQPIASPPPMLLMAGFEPYAHLLPSFPPEMPVVRIQSNLVSPDESQKKINILIGQRIAQQKALGGSFLILIPQWQHGLAKDALKAFGLQMATIPCQTVIDRLYNDMQLDLCDVVVSSHQPLWP